MNRKGSQPEQQQPKCNVKVCVRTRPLSDGERAAGGSSIVKYDGKSIVCKGKTYGQFDEVFDPSFSQKAIFEKVVRPQVDRVLLGYNCTVFAYGQTGTGKTYTMEGGRSDAANSDSDPTTGMTPRAVETIFQALEKNKTEEFTVRVSFVELYNEELYDLLAPNCDDRERLRLFDDPSKKGAVVISGAEETPVRTRQEVYDLLRRGAERRTTAATLMNRTSSRSHSIFTITVVLRESNESGDELVKIGKLNLVDLAGSEHIGRSGAEGKRAKEAGNINQSLLTLGRVITSLTSSAVHVPYRESKLTRMLQDSLGGSTITSLIATISPSSCSAEETISTLDYAMRAKNIKNHPECNQTVSRKALLKEYNAEIEKLRRDLFTARQKTGGVYLSTESYEDMEKQLSAKEQRIDELSEKLEAQFTKLQLFMEDMAFIDTQYQMLYKLNARFRQKLETRVTELDETKKALADTEAKLAAYTGAFKEAHKQARILFSELQETREAVKTQEGDAEQWWRVEDDLELVHSNNQKNTFRTVDKVTEQAGLISQQMEEILTMAEKTVEKLETKIKEVGLSGSTDIKVIRGNIQTVRHLLEAFEQKCSSRVKSAFEEMTASHSAYRKSLLDHTNGLQTVSNNTTELLTQLTKSIQDSIRNLTKSKEDMQKDVAGWIAREKNAADGEKKTREQFREEFATETTTFTANVTNIVNQVLEMINKKKEDDEKTIAGWASLDTEQLATRSTRLEELPPMMESFDRSATKELSQSEGNILEIEPRLGCHRDYIKSELAKVEKEVTEFTGRNKETAEQAVAEVDKLLSGHLEQVTTSVTVASDACDRVDLALDDLSHDIKTTAGEHLDQIVASKDETASSVGQVRGVAAALKRDWQQRSDDVVVPQRKHPVLDLSVLTQPLAKREKMLELHGITKELVSHSKTRESLLEVDNVPMSPGSLKSKKKTATIMDKIDEEIENVVPKSQNV